MTTDKEDPLLASARKERAKRWLHTDLHCAEVLHQEQAVGEWDIALLRR